MKPPRTEEEAVAITAVFWDIGMCPVPPGYDACRVGPCIKRFLENLGYSGPLTIFVVGLLTDVPRDVLQARSSFPGIALHHVREGTQEIMSLTLNWTRKKRPPANVMLISLPPKLSYLAKILPEMGFNSILPFAYDSPQKDPVLWRDFLLTDFGALDEDNCSETGDSAASWVCVVCNKVGGQGYENFLAHLSSQEHKRQDSWFPIGDYIPYGKDKEAYEARQPMDDVAMAKAVRLHNEMLEFQEYVRTKMGMRSKKRRTGVKMN